MQQISFFKCGGVIHDIASDLWLKLDLFCNLRTQMSWQDEAKSTLQIFSILY